MLRRQFRWVQGNLHRFSSDVLGQSRRVERPQETFWHHILESIRDDTLPRSCRARSSMACAATVFLTINDEEGWKLQQGIMMQLDPKNRCGWRHSKLGRIGRWEGVMLRCMGPRWKDTLLVADSAAIKEEDYLDAGRRMVGRSGGTTTTVRQATDDTTEDLDEQRALKKPRLSKDA